MRAASLNVTSSLLSNGTFLKEHPNRILGRLVPATDRFGKAIEVVEGSMTDIEYGISIPEVLRYEQLDKPQYLPAKIEKILSATRVENTRKTKQKKAITSSTCADNLQCLGETIKKYNPGISKEAMTVWVTYQTQRGLFDREVILENDWKAYFNDIPDYLASQLGKHTAYDGQAYVPSVLYYSGNIYDQISALKAKQSAIIEAIGDAAFNVQLEQLEAIKPTLLRITDGEENKLTLSPFDKVFRDFRVRALADGTAFDSPQTIAELFKWNYLNSLDSNDFIQAKQKTSAYDIRYHWLQKTRFSRGTSDSEKAARKRAAQTIGAHLFDRFLLEFLTRDDRLRLEQLWNSSHNNYVEPDWSKIPVGFEINQHFKGGKLTIRPAQREGVAFLNSHGTGIIAYDVGVGKTMTSILYIADMMSKGLCKRPLIVVPNPTYEKWLGELRGVYAQKDIYDVAGKLIHTKGDLIAEGILPQHRINDYYNLGVGHLPKAQNEHGLTLEVADFSITVVTYEGLLKLGFHTDSEAKLVASIKAILSQGETGRDAAIVEEKIAALVDKALDKSELFIEDMGIDAIVVDEAHNFKNLFTQVRGEVVEGEYGDIKREDNRYELQGKNPSARAIKLFMLNRYIHLQHSRRNTIGLTATPFTNSPLEIYSMQALFDYDGLKEHGIENIVDYFNSFIDESYEAVWTSRGQFEPRAVVRGFNNLPTMQSIIFKYILYKTGDEAGILRPEKVVLPLKNDDKGVLLPIEYQANTEIPATEEQLAWFKEIANFARQRISELDSYYQTDHRGLIAGRDLIAINAAQLATLSPYLLPWRKVDESQITPEEFLASSPKLQFVMGCIKSVKAYHEDRNEPVSGQVIYSNRGTRFFGHIRQHLVEKVGYAEKEVAIIMGGISTKQKERIKKEFLEGKIKIIIGSATIREGIDLQKRSSVLYNCFLDWNPTDIKQLEGRVWRFGNIYSHVRIVVPLIENSFDIFLNQKLGEKTSRVNNIWSKAGRNTVLKLEELNPDELKKGLITDPKELVKITIEEEVQELAVQADLLHGYIKQLTEAASEQAEVNRLERKLNQVAERAKEAWAYPSSIEKTTIDKIAKMPTGTLKQLYQIVKAYAKTREWSDKYDLEHTIDEHIRKLKKLERTERNILAKNDLSIKDDFSRLIETYQQQVETITREITSIRSPQNQLALLEAFIAEKEAKQLQSKTLAERVEEFSRLNFLLECKDANFDGVDDEGNVCSIYGINRGDGMQEVKVYQEKDWELEFEAFKERKLAELPTAQRKRKSSKKAVKEWQKQHQLIVVKALERGENVPTKIREAYADSLPKSVKEIPPTDERPPFKMSAKLRAFMPKHQQSVVRSWSEDLKWSVLAPLDEQVQAIPRRQSKRDKHNTIVYAHFFYGGSDWYITEWTNKEILFGYAILNGDVVFSEMGSMSLEEFVTDGRVELDFYWTPKYLQEILHRADKNYFTTPKFYLEEEIKAGREKPVLGVVIPEEKPPEPKKDNNQKLKLAKAKAAAQKQRIRILELEQTVTI